MVDDRDLAQHLAHDDLDVLVVDRHTLRAVDALHAVDDLELHGTHALDAKNFLRVDVADVELLTELDVLTVFDQQRCATQHRVGDRLVTVVGGQDDAASAIRVLDGDATGGLGDRGRTLGGAGLEQLGDAGQTLGDVIRRGDTTGVEGAHRQLGSGLTDRLGRDDADGLADVDEQTGRERAAVAGGADADRGLAREHRAHLDVVHPGREQRVEQHVTDVGAGLGHDGALGVHRVSREAASVDRVLDVAVERPGAVGTLGRDRHVEALGGAAVGLADDDILRDVHQTTGEVAGVGGAECGVGQTLAGTVGRDEVLGHGEALLVGVHDRARDDLTLRVRHEATHTGDLANLHPVTTSTRRHHAVDVVVAGEVGLHGLGHLGGRLVPDLDELLATLGVGREALVELVLNLRGLLLVAGDDRGLGRRGHNVRKRDGHTGAGGPVEAGVLDAVERGRDIHLGVALGEVVDDRRDAALVGDILDVGVVLRKRLVEERATEGRLQQVGASLNEALGCLAVGEVEVLETDAHLGVEIQSVLVEGKDRLGHRRERPALAGRTLLERRQVVQTDDHVLRGQGHRATVGRLEDVVRREHEHAGLGLSLDRQRQVHGHLVTVEVGVERRADERVQLDRLALDELRLEGLDAETVKRGRAVEQHGTLADDLLEHVPDLRTRPLHHALGALDVLRVAQVDEALDHERLEQLERHLLGQTALVQLELRADDDDRAARVVHALAEQVLAEPALLALEHVAERLERAVAGARDGTTAAAVVEQRVDGLLQHALLVVDDDLGSPEVEKATQTVVAVDDTTVEVVEVGGREAATVELHHRAQLRRDHRNDLEHHRGRRVAGLQERVDDAQTLDRADLLLALAVGDLVVQVDALGLQVERLQTLLDGLGPHVRLEVGTEAVLQLLEDRVLGLEVADLQAAEVIPHALQLGDLLVERLAGLSHLLLGAILDATLLVALRALGLEGREVLFELGEALGDANVALALERLDLEVDLVLEAGKVGVATLLIHRDDHVGGEVDDLLEVLRRHVEQVAEAAGHTLEVPDVRDRRGELDVAHALATHGGLGDLHAAALAHDALEAHALVLAARALPVAARSEDLLSEEAVLLGLERAVVDGLGLLHLAVRPTTDVVSGGQADLDFVKRVNVEHLFFSLRKL